MKELIIYGFVVAGIILIIIGAALFLVGINNRPCQDYRYWAIQDVPAHCVKELTQ